MGGAFCPRIDQISCIKYPTNHLIISMANVVQSYLNLIWFMLPNNVLRCILSPMSLSSKCGPALLFMAPVSNQTLPELAQNKSWTWVFFFSPWLGNDSSHLTQTMIIGNNIGPLLRWKIWEPKLWTVPKPLMADLRPAAKMAPTGNRGHPASTATRSVENLVSNI